MLNWPDIHFPPVNLYSAPRASWPHMYLELEHKYCKKESDEFDTEDNGTMYKEVLRDRALRKREEFNRLWNARSREV